MKYNRQFEELLNEFGLSNTLDFEINLPEDIKKILEDEIVHNEYGISLKSFGPLYKAKETWENQSTIEDNENHFHVDYFEEFSNSKSTFMLGVKTLKLLAEKFKQEKFSNLRFWFSFQTLELAKEFDRKNGFGENGSKHFISDRLSFHLKRENEVIISLEKENHDFAILIIDI